MGEGQAKALLAKRFRIFLLGRVSNVAGKMKKSGTMEQKIREALFLHWKGVVKSGTIADGFRDAQDDKVINMVLARPAMPAMLAGTRSLTNLQISTAVAEAMVELVF